MCKSILIGKVMINQGTDTHTHILYSKTFRFCYCDGPEQLHKPQAEKNYCEREFSENVKLTRPAVGLFNKRNGEGF